MATTYTVLDQPTILYTSDDAVTTVYDYAKFNVGQYRFLTDGRVFRFIRFSDGTANAAGTAGQLVYYTATAVETGVVTNDASDASLNRAAGVLAAGMTDGQLGWMQVRGVCTVNTNGDDDITTGLALIGSTVDGGVNSMAANTAATNKIVGFSLASDDDTANTVVAELCLG